MIEETATSGCEIATQIPTMKVSNSHGIVRRSRDTDFTTSGITSDTGKRRRLCSQDHANDSLLLHDSRLDADVILRKNVVSTAVSGTSDHVNTSSMCSVNDDSSSDLKAECLSQREIFTSNNNSFSRDTSVSSAVCLESEEIETLSMAAAENEATSGRKPPAAKSPPAAELEIFFAKAEKYEQKRFAEKYNYDIVKDVPMEGRYQWILLKP